MRPTAQASGQLGSAPRPQLTVVMEGVSMVAMAVTAADHFDRFAQPPVHDPSTASFIEVDESRTINMSGGSRAAGRPIAAQFMPVTTLPPWPVNGGPLPVLPARPVITVVTRPPAPADPDGLCEPHPPSTTNATPATADNQDDFIRTAEIDGTPGPAPVNGLDWRWGAGAIQLMVSVRRASADVAAGSGSGPVLCSTPACRRARGSRT